LPALASTNTPTVNLTKHQAVLQDVLYVPDFTAIYCPSHITSRDADIHFVGRECLILDKDGELVCSGHRSGANLYIKDMDTDRPATADVATVTDFPAEGDNVPPDFALASFASRAKADLHTWHHRLGHLHEDAVLRMLKKGLVRGMDLSGTATPLHPCEPCLKGKQTRSEIPKETDVRADTVLGRNFSDVCGPLSTRSHAGFKYFATFTNNKTRKVFVVGMCRTGCPNT
jgi:hypothetical protein